MPLTRLAHHLITQHFAPLECQRLQALDATCGNGFDTVFLTSLGFGKILAFDVQQYAILSTRTRLETTVHKTNLAAVKLIHQGHETIEQHITQPIDCAIFNLGYLPKADNKITTHAETTLTALNATLAALAPQGMITILCYPGHATGAHETRAVKTWLSGLASQWHVETYLSQSPNSDTPILYCVKQDR